MVLGVRRFVHDDATMDLSPDFSARLHALQADARAAGLTTALVRDAGRTERATGTGTCLGLGPAGEAELDPLTGELSLL